MSGRHCVVTGARGIAAAVAAGLARRGARVFVIAEDAQQCADLSKDLGASSAGWVRADLREEVDAKRAFDKAVERLDGVDAVVAVVGGSGRRYGDGALHETSLEAWNETLRLNLTTTFLSAREALRVMRPNGGSLVLTTSVLAFSPSPQHFRTHAYAAAKAAIIGLTTSLAAAYANERITVNALAPGLINTPMAVRALGDPSIQSYLKTKQPLTGGGIEAYDVAEAACWLVEGRAVTGQIVVVDGGWTVSEPI